MRRRVRHIGALDKKNNDRPLAAINRPRKLPESGCLVSRLPLLSDHRDTIQKAYGPDFTPYKSLYFQ